MKIPAIKIAVGEFLPKWYYGYSHRLVDQAIYVFYPIPLNFIVRWSVYFKDWWDRFRSRPNYFDRLLHARTKELNSVIKELRLENSKLKNGIRNSLTEIRFFKNQLR